MIKALELPMADRAERLEAVPYYSSEQIGGPHQACAAMMLAAVMEDGRLLNSPAAMAQFTGVRRGDERFSTGLRTLQSFSDRGIGVAVVGQRHYKGFVSHGANALSDAEAASFRLLSRSQQLSEQYTAELLIGKISDPNVKGYEQRAATMEDVYDLTAAGWVAQLELNARQLNGAEGYRQLPVVVAGQAEGKLMLHIPGNSEISAAPDFALSHEELMPAWRSAGFVLHAVGKVRQIGSWHEQGGHR